MSLGPIRSERVVPAQKSAAGSAGRVEKASAIRALPHDMPCRKRREHHESANGPANSLYRSGTHETVSVRYTRALDSGFVAQVIGQITQSKTANKRHSYAEPTPIRSALLLDRSI
jgi:hypothetical protein